MWKGRQEGNIAKQAHCQRRKAQKQGCRVAGLQRARDVVLPGLEDLVIGKRISYGRPGLGRPWDEEGAGARKGSQGLAGGWRGRHSVWMSGHRLTWPSHTLRCVGSEEFCLT